jgi:hypothetical protein
VAAALILAAPGCLGPVLGEQRARYIEAESQEFSTRGWWDWPITAALSSAAVGSIGVSRAVHARRHGDHG